MKRLILLALLGVCLSGAAKKKQFEIQVVEATARRGEETIAVDAKVRNSGERRVENLIVLFDFLAAGNKVISTQQIPVDEEVLEPGQESLIQAKLRDHVRAVRFRVNATDKLGHDFQVLSPGPYVIE
jgi:hypothetical protein